MNDLNSERGMVEHSPFLLFLDHRLFEFVNDGF